MRRGTGFARLLGDWDVFSVLPWVLPGGPGFLTLVADGLFWIRGKAFLSLSRRISYLLYLPIARYGVDIRSSDALL